MTAKDCAHDDDSRRRLYRQLFTAFLVFSGLILLIIFLIFIILRPTSPIFILRDATIYQFNASSTSTSTSTSTPNFLTTNMQITLSSRNPNDRIGIYYLRLDTYASYRGQQITLPTLLPESYQGHKEIVEWSPFIYGESVPISPYLGGTLDQDLSAGSILVNVKIDGQVKWKVGTWVSGRYHLHVNCPAMLMLKNPSSGVAVGFGVGVVSMKVQLSTHCTVDV